MIETPRITRTAAQDTAVIRLTIPRAEVRQHFGPAVQEVVATLAAQQIAMAGPCFSYHLNLSAEHFDFEVGFPTTGRVAATGRVTASTLPEDTVAQTIYRGPYEDLRAAWGELMDWMAQQGHAPGGQLWERYLAGPESSDDPALWRTELNRIIAQ